MLIRKISMMLFLFCVSNPLMGQEAGRQLEGAGQFNKYLTPDQLDYWSFKGRKGETFIAHVKTEEFDPVLELALRDGDEDQVLFSIDDDGSESRFSYRLTEDGEYRIRVHAFKYKGGGNYQLTVQRFMAEPLSVGQTAVGTIDPKGKAYYWFEANKGQVLAANLKGIASREWKMLDSKGAPMDNWSNAVTIEEDGIHSIIVSGIANSRFELRVQKAAQQSLEPNQKHVGKLAAGEVDVWNFEGKPSDFQLITVAKQGDLKARLIYLLDKDKGPGLFDEAPRPDIQFLPIANKGKYFRFAVVLGQVGQYQLQLAANSDSSYTLEMQNPSLPIAAGDDLSGTLPVGGSAFYHFDATPGQLLSLSLRSEQFDPILRLYNDRGERITWNDDGDGSLGSLIKQMIDKKGNYRLQVATLGNGGGGQYALQMRRQKLGELEVDGRGAGQLELGGNAYWTFEGTENQTVLVSGRSSTCDITLNILSPEGVNLAEDDNGGMGTDSLLAVKLPKTGVYTIRVSAERGAGAYTLKIIDAD